MKQLSAYYIKGCKISRTSIFSGYIINIDNEPILDSIKRRLGMGSNKFLCEITNEGFEYDKVNIYTVPITELCLGDFLLITGARNN